MEFFDLTTSIQKLVSVWGEHAEMFEEYMPYNILKHNKSEAITPCKRAPLDPTLLSVRNSICITGLHWLSLQQVKQKVNELLPKNVALESLHVKTPGDVKDGALLVPKVLLVGRHCPGRKLIDDDGDSGQLDYIYDEICDMGADVFVVYLGLPRSVYAPMKHMVYHPRLIDLVFPQQPTLRGLAEDNMLITLVEGQDDLTFMQKNVLKEWLEKPVNQEHPVYQAADYLSSAELETFGLGYNSNLNSVSNTTAFYSENEVQRREKPQKKKKTKRKGLFGGRGRSSQGYQALPQNDLMEYEELEESSEQHHVEMEVYSGHNSHMMKLNC